MPHKAFLKKKSLLDRFKDDHKATGYIQSARAEHTWNNPLTRIKRTKKLNGWIKSFAGKNHIRKLSRFNAVQAHRHESLDDTMNFKGESVMQNEAMSLKGFIENLSDKLVNKYGLEKDAVNNYLDLHTEEMQELLDDKELSLKEKVLFVRGEITGEKDEAKARTIPEKTLQTVMANLVCLGKPGKAMQNYPVARRREIFDELEKRGWIEPNSFVPSSKGRELAKDWISLCQESKKSEFYMDGDDSEDYYYCHRCGRVTPSYELDAHDGFCSDCDAQWTAEHENESKKSESIEYDCKRNAHDILNYIKKATGYKNSYLVRVSVNDDEDDFYIKYNLRTNGNNYILYAGVTDYSITDLKGENTYVEGSTDLSGAMTRDLDAFCEQIKNPKNESKKNEVRILPNPTIIYKGPIEDAKKACNYVSKILANKGLGWGRVAWQAPKDGEYHYGHPEKDVYTVILRGSNN